MSECWIVVRHDDYIIATGNTRRVKGKHVSGLFACAATSMLSLCRRVVVFPCAMCVLVCCNCDIVLALLPCAESVELLACCVAVIFLAL
jgi:hypothetical protein